MPVDRTELARLLETVGDDPGFLAELAGEYLRDSADLVAELGPACAAGDAERLRRAAHTLASTSATFGARHLATLSRAVETAAADAGCAGAAPLLAAVGDEWERVRAALPEALPGRTG